MMNTSPRGIALLKQFEGFKQDAYQDVVGVWTIGYGFTEGVKAGDIMSREQAEERLREELQDYEYFKGLEARMIYGLKKVKPSNGDDVGCMVISTYGATHS